MMGYGGRERWNGELLGVGMWFYSVELTWTRESCNVLKCRALTVEEECTKCTLHFMTADWCAQLDLFVNALLNLFHQ